MWTWAGSPSSVATREGPWDSPAVSQRSIGASLSRTNQALSRCPADLVTRPRVGSMAAMSDFPDSALPQPAARVSDADRERAAEQLREAVSDGRLDLTELDERLTATYEAKTRADLVTVTFDLEPVRNAARPLALRTKSGSMKRTGIWTAPAEILAECTLRIDQARFHPGRGPRPGDPRPREREVRVGGARGAAPRLERSDGGRSSSRSGSILNKVLGDSSPYGHTIRVTGGVTSGVIKARHPRRRFIDWLLRRPHADA